MRRLCPQLGIILASAAAAVVQSMLKFQQELVAVTSFITLYSFHCHPFSHITDLEGHCEITNTLNMHAVNLEKFWEDSCSYSNTSIVVVIVLIVTDYLFVY